MKQSTSHAWPFVLSLAILLSLLVVTFVSLARPDFEWWGVGVALVVNLPLACLFVWATMQLALWLEHRRLNAHWRYVVEIATVVWLFLIVRQLHVSLLSAYISFPVDLKRTLLPATVIAVVLVQLVELRLYRQRVQREAEEKASYQRMMLRRQLSPHFLFNSLNVLASLTYQEPDTANRFTKKLSRTYRYILDTQERASVPLSDELRFVEDYVYLQVIRYGRGLHVAFRHCDRLGSQLIVPGSVQQLVENAIKHNITSPDQPLTVVVDVGSHSVTVSNNLQLRLDAVSHGTGLTNLRRQFAHFGRDIALSSACGKFTVTLPYVS